VRATLSLLLFAAAAAAQTRYADEFFAGKLIAARGNTVTLRYDFEKPGQMQDFEVRAPEGLAPKGLTGQAKIEGGRLHLAPNSGLFHRALSTGVVRARMTLQAHLRRDCGLALDTGAQFLLLDFFDYRFRRHGGPLLGVFSPGAPLKWRELGHAGPQLAARFFRMADLVEVEFAHRGGRSDCRIATFHLHRPDGDKLKEISTARFGFWCGEGGFEVEELVLTIELAPGYLEKHKLKPEFAVDIALGEVKETRLYKQAKQKPLSERAAAARRELSRRGPDGWERLYKLVRAFARKQGYAAVPIMADLGNGPEPERRAWLMQIAKKKSHGADVRAAALVALARWYPEENQKLLHEGLVSQSATRLTLFRALVERQLPAEVVEGLLTDPLLAQEAHSVLADLGRQPKDLGSLTRIWAREAHSPAAARALLEEFSEKPDWNLVNGLIRLLGDRDTELALGAHLLLMTLSGKDLPRDPDLWRSWVSAKRTTFAPPPLSSPGAATAAIFRGIRFLKRDLLDDGACVWPVSPDWVPYRVGATALCVYALRAAGVKPDDPALSMAISKTLLPKNALPDLDRRTYAMSLLALALRAVDPARFKPQLEVLAKRLSVGQLDNGQWTYKCHEPGYARTPKAGDNSNTQYAILGLRAARLAGVKIERKVWLRNAAFWQNSRNMWGGWGYGPRGSTDHELSMTAAGVATSAICMEALHGIDAVQRLRNSKRVKLGMNRLGEILLVRGYAGAEIYAIYGIERACILTGTKAFNDFDWYHRGASQLVSTQKESGAWGDPAARGVATGVGYGEAVDTAYALLFLKRATTGLPGSDGGGIVKVRVRRGSVGKH